MTLVQASIANKGDSIILIADRLLTTYLGGDIPDYETEWSQPKILSKGNVGIGFAGTALYADMVLSRREENLSDLDKIVENISNIVKGIRKEIVDNEIFRVTRVDADDFLKNVQSNIPEKTKEYVYGMLMGFEFGLGCIVAGFDQDKRANIYLIGDEGDKNCFTNFGVCSIGSGEIFSQIYFDQNQYDISMSEKQILFSLEKMEKK